MSKTIKKKSKRRRKAKAKAVPRFVLLGLPARWRQRLPKNTFVLCSDSEQIDDVARWVDKDSLWISSRAAMIDKLIRFVSENVATRRDVIGPMGDLLLLNPPRTEILPILHALFRNVIGQNSSFKTLPHDQLAEVLSASKEESRDLFIGGVIDKRSRTLALVRGNLERVVVPFSVFRPSGTVAPDFDHFELDDYGHTIRFGDYEAAADSILYQSDADFRRRINAKRRAEDRGFGPSLRRLRILRKLGRNDFVGVSEKTVARIERGEIKKPHGQTLDVICDTLNVEPEDIESF